MRRAGEDVAKNAVVLSKGERLTPASTALAAAGYEVLLIGRELPTSKPLDFTLPYQQHRLRCRFHQGKLFYLEFNLRLLLFLLRQPRPAAYRLPCINP